MCTSMAEKMWRAKPVYSLSQRLRCVDKLNVLLTACTDVGQVAVGIAAEYGLDGPGIETPVRARFFAHVQTGPEAYPASCTMGTGSFLGLKQLGHGADHPPPSSAEVKKE
jgi:hypothetical protein